MGPNSLQTHQINDNVIGRNLEMETYTLMSFQVRGRLKLLKPVSKYEVCL